MRKMSDLVRNRQPLMLSPEASIMEAAQKMRERQVGAVLVVEDDDRLVGILPGAMPSAGFLPKAWPDT